MTAPTDPPRWVLTLYVNGASVHSVAAVETIRRVCDQALEGRVELEVVDAHDAPERAAADQVLALPTLIRRLPPPLRQLVGGLADDQRVRIGLEPQPPSGRGAGDDHGPPTA